MKRKAKVIIIPFVLLMCFYLTSSILGKYTTTLPKTITLNITKVNYVAEVNGNFYYTLQEAIDVVPTDNTQTIINLLNDTSEAITVSRNKNIIFNLNSKTVSNNGNSPVIANNGTIEITNGNISSNAATQGAINNNQYGTLTISSGRVVMTGGRQALYNDKGNATITGSAYLSSSATARAAVQNQGSSTLTITGGTIVSTGSSGVQNAGTLIIGVKNDSIVTSSPVLQGVVYGLTTSQNVKFYDGIIKGVTSAINNVSKITEMENGYGIITDEEVINNVTYKTAYPGISNTVTFNANGGTTSETTRYIANGKQIGTLPTASRSGYEFNGWFTEKTNGTEINANTIINEDITFYAHWNKTKDVAMINNTNYDTLQDAINAVPNNTLTTITVLKDINEKLTVSGSKNIIFDLNGKTLSNFGNNSVIENSGNITLTNGTITSNANTGAINNNAGNLTVSTGARIIATGTRQSIYITAGTVEITGNAYLSSQTSGVPDTTTMERATVQCLSGGTLIITGGTIEGLKQQAVSNEGTLTIGTKDGSINTSTPVLIGNIHGVKTTGTFNFYDGIIKGKTDAIDGTITDQETNSQLINGTETIDGDTYIVNYLN